MSKKRRQINKSLEKVMMVFRCFVAKEHKIKMHVGKYMQGLMGIVTGTARKGEIERMLDLRVLRAMEGNKAESTAERQPNDVKLSRLGSKERWRRRNIKHM